MKNFGIIKSKIEKILVDSYQNNSLKESFVKFRNVVLNDKNVVSLFYLYDQLSNKNNIDKEIAYDYLNECLEKIKLIKLSNEKEKILKEWVKDIEVENSYENIDNLFDDNILNLESKVRIKKLIIETITSKSESKKDFINIPLKTSLNIANKSMANFIQELSEQERKEFIEIAKIENEKLIEGYNNLKESTIEKLQSLMNSNEENDVKIKLEETIKKIQNDSVDKLNYYRLKKLYETI